MLNPDGGMFFCENSEVVGNLRDQDPGEIYFSADSQLHRKHIKNDQCPTCLSRCQMNVSAIKQVVLYGKFLLGRHVKIGSHSLSQLIGQ